MYTKTATETAINATSLTSPCIATCTFQQDCSARGPSLPALLHRGRRRCGPLTRFLGMTRSATPEMALSRAAWILLRAAVPRPFWNVQQTSQRATQARCRTQHPPLSRFTLLGRLRSGPSGSRRLLQHRALGRSRWIQLGLLGRGGRSRAAGARASALGGAMAHGWGLEAMAGGGGGSGGWGGGPRLRGRGWRWRALWHSPRAASTPLLVSLSLSLSLSLSVIYFSLILIGTVHPGSPESASGLDRCNISLSLLETRRPFFLRRVQGPFVVLQCTAL